MLCTVLRSTPCSSRKLAALCRRTCSLSGRTSVASHSCVKARLMLRGSRWVPSAVVNTTSGWPNTAGGETFVELLLAVVA